MKKNHKVYVYGAIFFLIIVIACLTLAHPVTAENADGGGAYRSKLSGTSRRKTAGA